MVREETLRQISTALKQFPRSVWERALQGEPEFQQMKELSQRYPPGGFLTLMVIAGLNDYQLKGKAEKAYWPPLRSHLGRAPVPSSPEGLAGILEPFYRRERLGGRKVERLRRFLHSPLAGQLWTMTPAEGAKNLPFLWQKIAQTMGQLPSAKTIAFSAKTLAAALLLLGEGGFNFSGIPLPVDLRLQRLTPSLDKEDVRFFWDRVLERLREAEGRLTHLHLDSFLWQYAGARDPRAYLQGLGVPLSLAEQAVAAFGALKGLDP